MSIMTSEQLDQLEQVSLKALKDAYRDAQLDKEHAQMLLTESCPELKRRLYQYTLKQARRLSVTNQYANEEVKSSYTYPPEYRPKSLEDEYGLLRKAFPSITGPLPIIGDVLPAGAEKPSVILDWRQLSTSRAEATNKVLDAIKDTGRAFYNHRQGQIVDERLRIHPRTDAMLETIRTGQKSSALVIPTQFGMNHRGRSVRRAREVIASNPLEIGFGAFEVGCMLLTNPERLARWEQLHCDCPGDEFDDPGDGQRWFHAPMFDFYEDVVGFDADWVSDAVGHYGSVSGFLPQ